MLRITVFLSFILISVAFIHEVPELMGNEVLENKWKITYSNPVREKLWVLELNGVWDLHLSIATSEEEEDFKDYYSPMIENYKIGHRTMKKAAASMPVKDVEKDIFRLLNKIALSTSKEPNTYLSESHENDDPSITLFFQGPYTSLTLTIGNRQWNFFINPSKLPAWFYTRSDEDLLVPETVKPEFYAALYRLLHSFMRIPL